MTTPFELSALSMLRRRGQCPTMTVFVTPSWAWAAKLEDLGCLAIRVRGCSDSEHDWSPLCGLHVILLQQHGDYAALGQAILAANPKTFETFTLRTGARLVCGTQPKIRDRCRRDELLVMHLLSEAA